MTDEAFAELLLTLHAASNGMERQDDGQELQDMHAALTSYRRATTHWAERRSAAQPSLAARARAQQRWAALPQWALAMVALVTITGGVVHLLPDRADEAGSSVAATMPVAEHATTADDLAADNHLLSSIDAELSYHAGSPVEGLRLQERSAPEHAAVIGAAD